MKNKRIKAGALWMAAGVLLMVSALLLAAHNLYRQEQAGKSASHVLSEMKFDTPLSPDNTGERIIPDYVLNPDMDMPSEEIDGFAYIGKLEIPAFHIAVPVMKEWSYQALRISPCCYAGSIYKNNMVIAGHNYSSHFGNLQRLLPGDDIIFTDIDGNVFAYSAAETEILAPDRTEEMTKGDYPLTLFTCTAGGASRVTVRCEAKGK